MLEMTGIGTNVWKNHEIGWYVGVRGGEQSHQQPQWALYQVQKGTLSGVDKVK